LYSVCFGDNACGCPPPHWRLPPPLTGGCPPPSLPSLHALPAEILLSGVRDYGFAGDYDYNLVTALVDSGTGVLYSYDYDYGQPRFIPETSLVSTRSSIDLDRLANRFDIWPAAACCSEQSPPSPYKPLSEQGRGPSNVAAVMD
jgi:hypothetical protein